MNRLERIDAICLEQQEFPCAHVCCGNDLAAEVAPLLPLLREWAEARRAYSGSVVADVDAAGRRMWAASEALADFMRGGAA